MHSLFLFIQEFVIQWVQWIPPTGSARLDWWDTDTVGESCALCMFTTLSLTMCCQLTKKWYFIIHTYLLSIHSISLPSYVLHSSTPQKPLHLVLTSCLKVKLTLSLTRRFIQVAPPARSQGWTWWICFLFVSPTAFLPLRTSTRGLLTRLMRITKLYH